MSFWIAFVPFVVLFIWLIPLRRPAVEAAPLAFLAAVAAGIFAWQMPSSALAAALADTAVVYLEVMLIITFALLFLNLLVSTGKMKAVEVAIGGVSQDSRVIAMLIGWGLVSLIEGIAGFGTPALLAAPLLVLFGMAPFKAVIVALIGNSIAVPFGAAGTPVLIGLAGLGLDEATLTASVIRVAILLAVVSVFVTWFMTWVVTRGEERGRFREFLPFATFSALSFAVPYLLVAWLVGPEMPSIIGGAFAIGCIAFTARSGFLIARSNRAENLALVGSSQAKVSSSVWRAAAFASVPLVVLTVALLLSRTIMPIRQALLSVKIRPFEWFGLESGAALTPLYTPYAYFALALLTSILLFRARRAQVLSAASLTFGKIRSAAIVLVFVIALTQVFLKSGSNLAGLPSMPEVLAFGIATGLGESFILLSAFLGAFGSFMTGSATVSNLLFAQIQVDTGIALALSIPSAVALQMIGAAIGNMISLQNIAMATAAAGVETREGNIIKETIVPVVVIGAVAGILFWIF